MSTISNDSITEFKRNGDTVAIAYIAIEDEERQEQFQSLADVMHPECVFGVSHDLELAKAEGVEPPIVAVYKSREAEMVTISLSRDTSRTKAALRKASRPLIFDLAFNTHDDILDVS